MCFALLCAAFYSAVPKMGLGGGKNIAKEVDKDEFRNSTKI